MEKNDVDVDGELAKKKCDVRLSVLEKQMAAMIDRYNHLTITQDWLRYKLLELVDEHI